MKLDIKRLKVMYNKTLVGYLEMIDPYRIAFQYAQEWVKSGFSISPLSLPLSDKVYISDGPYFGGLYGVFYDSLPDGWGEFILRRKLLKEGINFDKLTPLARLTLVNKTGLGGLEYIPTQIGEHDNSFANLDELMVKIDNELTSNENRKDLDQLFLLGGASGGARPKVHLKIKEDHWIIKFKALQDGLDVGLMEYEANHLASKVGIQVADFNMFESKITKGYFGSKRFDRVGNKKVHVISLSALLETTHRISNLDYIHLFQVISKISVDNEDLYEAFKRMTFNVLFGNKDDHGKNHAFIYDEIKKGYILSKAYDITKTPFQLEHEMTVNGKGNPGIEDLMSVQKKMMLSESRCLQIIEDIQSIL